MRIQALAMIAVKPPVVIPEEKYAQPGAERRILFLPEKLT